VVRFYSQQVNYAGEDSGFPDAAAVEAWQSNCCGIACARMVLAARTGTEPGYWSLLQQGLARGAYIEAGWIHRGLVDLIGTYGVAGICHRKQAFADVQAAVARGSLAIVSVTAAFRPGRGGHLVLAFAGPGGEVLCHHPSTLPDGNRQGWLVAPERWEAAMTGNWMEFPG
jgi:hypothetical protein